MCILCVDNREKCECVVKDVRNTTGRRSSGRPTTCSVSDILKVKDVRNTTGRRSPRRCPKIDKTRASVMKEDNGKLCLLYEVKRESKRIHTIGSRYNERLNSKTEGSKRLDYTGLTG